MSNLSGTGAGSGSWQLSAELKPAEADAEPDSGEPSPTSVTPPAWSEAAAGVQTTVKWMVAAFAAVGAVMFAKGFVTTPKLSWSENSGQLIVAWVLGVIGLLGIGWLIAQAVEQLRPGVFTLGTLPTEFVRLIESEPLNYLPDGCRTLEAFRRVVEHTRRAVDANKATIQAAVQEAEVTLALATEAQQNNEASLAAYNRVRQHLLNRAEYFRLATAFPRSTSRMVFAAVIAAAGGIGYQLALASTGGAGTAEARPRGSEPTMPAVGQLVRSDTDAGQELWRQLDLDRCQTDASSARIVVVVASGKGSPADPYVVSTIPTSTCPAQTFTVLNDVARVSVPVQKTIPYTPAPNVGSR